MFLSPLLDDENLDENTRKTLLMVISQLNLLLSLVNGLIDLSAIGAQKFEPKAVTFRPMEVITFIKSMFEPQTKFMVTKIIHKIVTAKEIDG